MATKTFDLGTKTVTAILNPNLTFTLRDNSTGREVKSIPKRGADPEKYEQAKEGFSKLKKQSGILPEDAKLSCFKSF